LTVSNASMMSTKRTCARLAQILSNLEGDLKWSNGIGTSVSASVGVHPCRLIAIIDAVDGHYDSQIYVDNSLQGQRRNTHYLQSIVKR
jgi:hypothetical protein